MSSYRQYPSHPQIRFQSRRPRIGRRSGRAPCCPPDPDPLRGSGDPPHERPATEQTTDNQRPADERMGETSTRSWPQIDRDTTSSPRRSRLRSAEPASCPRDGGDNGAVGGPWLYTDIAVAITPRWAAPRTAVACGTFPARPKTMRSRGVMRLGLMSATIVGIFIAAQPRAHADSNDPSTIYLGLTMFGITDVTFTAIDVVQAVRREPLSRTYGVVEIALGLSQVALIAVLEQQNPPHTSGYRLQFDGAYCWTIALAAPWHIRRGDGTVQRGAGLRESVPGFGLSLPR